MKSLLSFLVLGLLCSSIKGVCSLNRTVTQIRRLVLLYKRCNSPLFSRTHGRNRVEEIFGCLSVKTLLNREMNTTEKFYLSVDGILKMFNSVTGQSPITHRVVQSVVPQNPKVPNISKTGIGIRTVKASWGQQGKKADQSSLSTDRLTKGSVDMLELGLAKPRNCHRIVVLGAPRVGKTSILQRFLGNEFEDNYEPTTEDFHRKLFHIRGKAYQIDLLDAAGERNFPAKRRLSILTGEHLSRISYL